MIKVEKLSVTDIIVSNLIELITSGKLSVNEKLPTEMKLCEQYNVSRSSVREAMKTLQAMGYVELKRGTGAFVKKILIENEQNILNWFAEHEVQLLDFMDVRMAIEPLAIKLAIKRATDREIKNLVKIHMNFEKAMKDKEAIGLARYDEAFHSAIIEATHNQLLIIINRKVTDAFTEYRNRTFSLVDSCINALRPHCNIMESLKRRDIDGGVTAMVEHLDITLDDIVNVAKMGGSKVKLNNDLL
jgi:Transcriptional regulators